MDGEAVEFATPRTIDLGGHDHQGFHAYLAAFVDDTKFGGALVVGLEDVAFVLVGVDVVVVGEDMVAVGVLPRDGLVG